MAGIMGKLRVAVVFGGRSAEHEVSLLSAKNVVAALNPDKYDPVLIGIDRDGRWFLNEGSLHLLNDDNAAQIALNSSNGSPPVSITTDGELLRPDGDSAAPVDVIFPVLHGPYGEDGTIQGLAKLANIPCVGAGVLGSAVGMDKDVMKRLLREAGLPIAPFMTIASHRRKEANYEAIRKELGDTVFVKPANLGSSVGISRAATRDEFEEAVAVAFRYDTKIIVEAAIVGREIECAVLGNEHPVASVPGEVVPRNGFYSYEAKYLDEDGAELLIPADLGDAEVRKVQRLSIRAFEVLCCEGMARVDGFLRPNGDYLINEINTIPGFTKISQYPKLFEASGMPLSELVDRLITLAMDRHRTVTGLSIAPRE
jgi:D-alanine-D-alanine ligase